MTLTALPPQRLGAGLTHKGIVESANRLLEQLYMAEGTSALDCRVLPLCLRPHLSRLLAHVGRLTLRSYKLKEISV